MANVYNKPIIIVGGGGAELPVDNGAIYEGKYRIRYFDVDGTILKIEYVADGGKLTPPDNPTYDPDYLIFDEWNYDIENYVVERPTDVGATYKTVDDATYMFCRFTNGTGLSPNLYIENFVSIDWGDGTIDTSYSHTYEKEGNYVIKILGSIRGRSATNPRIMGSTLLNSSLNKVYIGSLISVNYMTFLGCDSLEVVSMNKEKILTDYDPFSYCKSLKTIIIPKQSSDFTLQSRYATYTTLLQNVSIPENVKILNQYAFQYSNISEIILPKNINTLARNSLSNNPCLKNIFISSIPTLSNVDAFISINGGVILWVKDDIIEDLKVATNWSTFADKMKPFSWYPNLTNPNA